MCWEATHVSPLCGGCERTTLGSPPDWASPRSRLSRSWHWRWFGNSERWRGKRPPWIWAGKYLRFEPENIWWVTSEKYFWILPSEFITKTMAMCTALDMVWADVWIYCNYQLLSYHDPEHAPSFSQARYNDTTRVSSTGDTSSSVLTQNNNNIWQSNARREEMQFLLQSWRDQDIFLHSWTIFILQVKVYSFQCTKYFIFDIERWYSHAALGLGTCLYHEEIIEMLEKLTEPERKHEICSLINHSKWDIKLNTFIDDSRSMNWTALHISHSLSCQSRPEILEFPIHTFFISQSDDRLQLYFARVVDLVNLDSLPGDSLSGSGYL